MTGTVRRDQVIRFAYDWLMSPTRILHGQASFDRFVENFPDDSSAGEFTYDKLGIKSIPAVPTYPNKLAPREGLEIIRNDGGVGTGSGEQQATEQYP